MLNAVIDIGSTSVRLMVTDGVRVQKKVNTTRLAEGMGEIGVLRHTNMDRSAQAVAEYFFTASAAGAEKVYCYATEAVRSARNSRVLCEMIKNLCGLDVDILTKKEEAEAGFLGAYDGGICAVVDMGGASTELTVGTDKDIIYSYSLPYGIVRLAAKEKSGVDLHEYINNKLADYGEVPRFDHIVAIGGTITTMSAMMNKLDIYDPNVVNGHTMTIKQIKNLYDAVKPMSFDERKRLPGLPEKRADIITSGIQMYALLLDYLGFDSLTVSEGDGTEGYLIKKGVLPAGFKALYGAII